MDYAGEENNWDVRIDGVTQFNTVERKDEMCAKLTERLPQCSYDAFSLWEDLTEESVPSPPAPAPTTTTPAPVEGGICMDEPEQWADSEGDGCVRTQTSYGARTRARRESI